METTDEISSHSHFNSSQHPHHHHHGHHINTYNLPLPGVGNNRDAVAASSSSSASIITRTGQSQSVEVGASSMSIQPPPRPPQDGHNNNNNNTHHHHHSNTSTSYADAVMNGSLHDSMTHLDMNNGNGANVNDNGLPIQQSRLKLGKNNNSNSSSSNSQKSQSNDNSQRLELELDPQHSNNNNTINARPQDATATNNDNSVNVNVNVNNSNLPHPDPNHNEFAAQSGGQTTCQHTAINYTDYRRRASDAMSVDLQSDHPSLQIQQHREGQTQIATYSSIIVESSNANGVVAGDSSLQQQALGGVNGGNTEISNGMVDSQQHQYHQHQEEGQSQQQQQQSQHAALSIQNNIETTTTTSIMGEATMAVHNHDYTTINNNNNNNNNNNSTTSSQSPTYSSSQMVISVPKLKQPWTTSSLSSDNGSISGGVGGGVGGRMMERLSDILRRGTLVMINFSQRNLGSNDAPLIRSAILSNPQLAVLKLGYNNLGNVGANLIAEAIHVGGGLIMRRSSGDCGVDNGAGGLECQHQLPLQQSQQQSQRQQQQQQQYRHHPSLSVLDLGFNNVGDEGCTSLANLAVARNPSLATLYLSGNAVREAGALALADVIAAGCGLTSLHLTANRICARGVKGLMRSIAEFDVTMQMAQQDRENRMALEEEKKKRVLKSSNNGVDHNTGRGGGGGGEEQDAILDSFEFGDGDDGHDDFARLSGYKCIKELHLGGTNMESTGCLSVSNMLLTNLSLRVLCLSDNGLNDQDLSLFSQSISRNRQLPLETLRLSFNKLTCVGVETLMNAIWGSKTLREIKLDNNQIRDRGAQLAAVVLTSVELEVLDMGFNRLTIVGIKALMKSLAENCSLLTLTLSGNVLDTNASKAVSYALAYNKTIQKLYVDHCSLSYAAQRHIAAGIVSNSKLALRVMSGFPLGAISVTLGLPGAMENWTNEQVLKFIRVMWDRTRHEKEEAASGKIASTIGAPEASAKATSANSNEKEEPKSGPSDPATVVAAAKGAFEALGDAGGALLLTEEPQRAISDTSPMVSSDAVMLEKTPSGTVRVPSLNEYPHEHFHTNNNEATPLDTSVSHASHASVDSLCTANGKSCPETPVDPEAKKRNMEWLRLHYRSLNEIIQLPYVYADLLQLYRYFYSSGEVDDEDSVHDGMPPPGPGFNLGTVASPSPQKMSGLQRKISYRGLDVIAGGKSTPIPSSNFSHASESSSKRRPMSEDESMQPPANKRARSGKPRIDYFPRLKAQVESCLSSSKQTKALILLRQLKFVETTMFQGSNPYCDQSLQVEPNEPIALDAEIILIDMI